MSCSCCSPVFRWGAEMLPIDARVALPPYSSVPPPRAPPPPQRYRSHAKEAARPGWRRRERAELPAGEWGWGHSPASSNVHVYPYWGHTPAAHTLPCSPWQMQARNNRAAVGQTYVAEPGERDTALSWGPVEDLKHQWKDPKRQWKDLKQFATLSAKLTAALLPAVSDCLQATCWERRGCPSTPSSRHLAARPPPTWPPSSMPSRWVQGAVGCLQCPHWASGPDVGNVGPGRKQSTASGQATGAAERLGFACNPRALSLQHVPHSPAIKANIPTALTSTCKPGQPAQELRHGQRVPVQYFTFGERHRRKSSLLTVNWRW